MRVIFCGDRNWQDFDRIHAEIDRLRKRYGKELVIVHGGCRGADTIADQYAQSRGVTVEPHYADWDTHEAKAGPIRNREMAQSGVQGVVAFDRGGAGTASMMRIAREMGIPVIVRKGE